MDHKQLCQSARKIQMPSLEATSEYNLAWETMAIEMNQLMLAREDLDNLIGPDNRAMMEDNHRNHARFMNSLFLNYVPVVFVETVLWVYHAYRSHGFRLAYWPAQLNTWVEVMRKRLSPEALEALYPFYEWMLLNQAAFAELSGKGFELLGETPTHE